jgi:acetyl-CoA acetyltransferase
MKPAFKKDGSVTAGNASGINDGAAFLVLASADAATAAGHQPMARIVSYAVCGVPNHIMGEGPIPATRAALQRAGLSLEQMDVIESTKPLLRNRWPCARDWVWIRHAATPMVEPSRLVTRWVPAAV